MDLKEAVTVAIALKCLILMVASQSEETGDCFDASKEIKSCEMNEFVKLTVLDRSTTSSKGLIFDFFNVRYDVAFKSDMGIADGMSGYITIPEGHSCPPNLFPNVQFVLIADNIDHSLNAIQLCLRETHQTYCQPVEILFVMKDSTTS